ncbi:hypothetical protein AHiyo6_21680, partial [Arthrobacter sp. Hiyo6]
MCQNKAAGDALVPSRRAVSKLLAAGAGL